MVFQATGERSYHVFYQLVAGRDAFPDLQLKAASEFHYLNSGNCVTIEGVDDTQSFVRLQEAFTKLKITDEERNSCFRVLAAILNLGDITFTSKGAKEPAKISNSSQLEVVATLLGVTKTSIEESLCQRTVLVKGNRKESVYTVPLIIDQVNFVWSLCGELKEIL